MPSIYGYTPDDTDSEVEYVLSVTWHGSDDLAGCEMTGFISVGKAHMKRRAIRADITISMKAKAEPNLSFALSNVDNGRDQFCSFYDVKSNDLTNAFATQLKGGNEQDKKSVQFVASSSKTFKNDYKGIITFQDVINNASIENESASFSWQITSANEGAGSVQISSKNLTEYVKTQE